MSPLYLYLQVLILLIIALILTNYNHDEEIFHFTNLCIALDCDNVCRRTMLVPDGTIYVELPANGGKVLKFKL